MEVNSIKDSREAGENGTQKAIRFKNQEFIDDLQGSRFSELWRQKPDYREFYISFEIVETVSTDYFCMKSI